MTSRREMLTGAAAFTAAALAWRLEPHERLDLLGGRRLDALVPARFGGWASRPSADLVRPRTEGTLSARLYSDILSRVYQKDATGETVMMLIAYGGTQSDLLQLHRPESCYPAFGYRIARSGAARLEAAGRSLPVRELVAAGPARTESILYWTRVGDLLPVSSAQQRADRLRMAMAGYVADGLLARFSVLGDGRDSFARLAAFARALLAAVPRQDLPALIGRG